MNDEVAESDETIIVSIRHRRTTPGNVSPNGTVVGFSYAGTDPGERSSRRAWVSSTAPDAVALDLTALLQGSGFISINEVSGINDDQQICGDGTIDENGVPRLRAFVLDIVLADWTRLAKVRPPPQIHLAGGERRSNYHRND